jgi:capsule polysaccharide modification protein KpsS
METCPGPPAASAAAPKLYSKGQSTWLAKAGVLRPQAVTSTKLTSLARMKHPRPYNYHLASKLS